MCALFICVTHLLHQQKQKTIDFLSAMMALLHVHFHAISVCVSMTVCAPVCLVVEKAQYICPLGLCESDGYIVLLVCLADIQIVWRYPEAAAEKCNLSHSTGPGYKVDYEKGGDWREREVASGLSCQKDLWRERF